MNKKKIAGLSILILLVAVAIWYYVGKRKTADAANTPPAVNSADELAYSAMKAALLECINENDWLWLNDALTERMEGTRYMELLNGQRTKTMALYSTIVEDYQAWIAGGPGAGVNGGPTYQLKNGMTYQQFSDKFWLMYADFKDQQLDGQW